MQWLNKIVDEAVARQPKGEILIESGGSPSGTYHLGHLRELVICDAILLELRGRGREARHVYYVDDLDALRKIPGNVPAEFDKYLGQALCDVPSPDGLAKSYADFFIQGLIDASAALGIDVEFIRSYKKYRAGFFVPAIEIALEKAEDIAKILEKVSGHKLGDSYSPIQIMEGEYLKKRPFVSIDKDKQTLVYLDKDGAKQGISYAKGQVKLDWRIDWPARWWLLKVGVEPAGRDHSTKGGSFDTGLAIAKDVFDIPGPLPVPYDFINLAGDNKKMSASAGTGLDAATSARILPPEVFRYFILRAAPGKRLYFDPVDGLVKLIDEFVALVAKPDKTKDEEQLLDISRRGLKEITVAPVPFSHLVASYQSALKDPNKTLEAIRRTGYAKDLDERVVKNELRYIDEWLKEWAPEDVKFELRQKIDSSEFSQDQKNFLAKLAEKIASAPTDADGEWFHKVIYDLQEKVGMEPRAAFEILYKALIGKTSGPRAGWFLSILPRDWLIKRLNLEA